MSESQTQPSQSQDVGEVHLSLPLAYQQTLVTELLDEDALLIIARGLGLPRIVTNLIHAYDVAGGNLVLIIGADDREIEWIGEGLAELGTLNKGTMNRTGLTVVNTEMMSLERREMLYSAGGVFAVTSRILVVDILSDVIATNKITGIIVLHAEKVTATSQEAFILRLFRERNKAGFIKAFSDMPESFITGFSPLTNMLKHMFLRKASLWPRFQVLVAESLEQDVTTHRKLKDVIEVSVSLTPSMKEIQTAVLECVDICLRELRRSSNAILDLDDDDWAVENALHTNFDVRIRRQLDPVWHRLNYKSRQMVSDLTTLRQILNYLLNYDCVSFNKMLDIVIAANTPSPGSTRSNSSPWLFLDAANVLFTVARQRVYVGAPITDITSSEAGGGKKQDDLFPDGITPVLEEQPKWEQLGVLLDEITADLFSNPHATAGSEANTVLIMCAEERTCDQIKEYLSERGHAKSVEEQEDRGAAWHMLRRKLREYISWKPGFANARQELFVDKKADDKKKSANADRDKSSQPQFRGRPPPNKRRRVRGRSAVAASSSRKGSGMAIDLDEVDSSDVVQLLEEKFENEDIESSIAKTVAATEALDTPDEYFFELFDMNDIVAVLPYDGDMDDYVLEELQPKYVIMYEPDAAFIRRLEVHRASNRDSQLKIYLMYYGDSIEEQRYLSAVRKEKDAFSKLIRERANMAMVMTTDVDDLAAPEDSFLRKVNTRIAGGGRMDVLVTPPRVIVDMREFRSSLPSLLHGRQLVIVPSMLTVGDYILSPHICVERKSIPDLISSFRDGRLYSQCETMTHYYKTVVLLIEFDQNKSFSLEPFSDVSASTVSASAGAGGAIGGYDLQAKLVLLVLSFPNLRIIWSSSPYQTAEIFLELKRNHEEPDPETATNVGLDELGENSDSANLYNQAALDMVRSMPGITAVNYRNLMYDVENFQQLCQMSESEIAKSVGREAARKVWRFINRDLRTRQEEEDS
ncbi:hypothetical protein POJ06DRAFT_150391 [Lipomyces tetrasporus]|uniref:ERCC4 domain-containing protein n=1 Tax=Lipomyces tetrasporus TaxID=54092 RepID=A0AAD7QN26_9ASCO|nr:uncharacterized protein POJ06DRAFT_150391 [Lipomyces tetrasporus]KAJ8098375.1 hypothetical protein POJ06DRAFT_150391 [Lipomyces tetrasporus]